MKFSSYILASLLILTLVSCKKDELPELPDANEPYYSIRGLVNGDSINWVVGLDENTLSYGTSSMNGVETYYGQINSGNSDMAIRIEILRPEVIYDGQSIAAIKTDNIKYLVHETASVKFNFGMNYEQFNYVLVKNELNNFEFMNAVDMHEFGMHSFTLKFTDYSSTESFVVPIPYGFENTILQSQFHASGNADTLVVEPNVTEGTHSWYLNGELVSENTVFEKKMDDGIYEIRHKLKDGFNNVSEYTTLIRMKDGEFYWQLKYYYLDPAVPTSHYGNVLVSMHKNGTWYSSDKSELNLEKPFEVSNITTILNTQFQPVSTMFDFDFGTVLYNESQTDSLYLPQMVGSVNVGLK